MTKDAYLIGGPAAGRVFTIPDDQEEITVQFVNADSAPGKIYREGRYAPKNKSDLVAQEFHWMGEY
jgi:hypothetical protein